MEKYGKNSKYIIPIDAGDFSLLSISNAPKQLNAFMPVWSKSNLKMRSEDGYYEFEIKYRPEIVDTDEYESCNDTASDYSAVKSSSDTCMCFICNLLVPRLFMSDHVRSFKHQSYMKIIDDVLERVKGHVKQNDFNETKPCLMYFCENCTFAVPVKDKKLHFQSESHKNAFLSDNLLGSLLNIFLNKNTVNDDIKLCTDYLNSPEVRDKNKEYILKTDKINEIQLNTERTIITETKEDIAYSNKIDQLSDNKQKKDYLEIETEDGCHIRVKFDYFHGFTDVGDGNSKCILCMKQFMGKNAHIYSAEHVKNIYKPVKNKNCVRELQSVKAHCILCNELIESYESHVLLNEHHDACLKDAFTDIVKDDKLCDKLDALYSQPPSKIDSTTEIEMHTTTTPQVNKDCKVNKTQSSLKEACCDICTVVMPIKSLYPHIYGRRHKMNEHKGVSYLMKKVSESDCLMCVVCNIEVVDSEAHTMNVDHIYRYDTLLAMNDIIMIDDDEFCCEICAVLMVKGNEVSHVHSKRHMILLKAARHEDTVKQEDKINVKMIDTIVKSDQEQEQHLDYFCQVCDLFVPNKLKKIKKHNSGALHNKYLTLFQSKVHDTERIKSFGNETCVAADEPLITNEDTKNETCVESIKEPKIKSNQDSVFASVIDTPKIKSNSKKQKRDINLSSKCNNDFKNINENKEEIVPVSVPVLDQSDLHLMHEFNAKESLCKICKIKVPNKTVNISQHLKGGNHNKNVVCLLEKNKLRKIDDIFYCEICYDYLAVGTHFTHIECNTHQKKLKNINLDARLTHKLQKSSNKVKHVSKASYDKIEDEIDKYAPSTSKCSSKIYPKTVKTPQKSYFEMKTIGDPIKMLCQICHVNIPNCDSMVDAHVKETEHIKQLEMFFDSHDIVKCNNWFVCLVCMIELPIQSVFSHVVEQSHIKNIEEYKFLGIDLIDEDMCYVCEQSISEDIGMSIHVLSEDHIANYKNLLELNNYLCEICDILLTNNKWNIKEHNNGSKHNNNVKLLERKWSSYTE